MKSPAPHYELSRILNDGRIESAEVIPVEIPPDSVDRRAALGTGIGAAAALLMLGGCASPKPRNIPVPPGRDKISYKVYDKRTRSYITYTMPCGSPVPPGAICTCNCVPAQRPAPTTMHTYSSCTCNQVCTCVPVYY